MQSIYILRFCLKNTDNSGYCVTQARDGQHENLTIVILTADQQYDPDATMSLTENSTRFETVQAIDCITQ